MTILHAERILQHLQTICTPATLGVTTVERNYPYALGADQIPFVGINQISDAPLLKDGPANLEFNDWDLQVEFLIATKSSTLPVDTALNAIRAALHLTLFTDYTQAGNCYNTVARDVTIEVKEGTKADSPAAVMKCVFSFIYRTKISDPTF